MIITDYFKHFKSPILHLLPHTFNPKYSFIEFQNVEGSSKRPVLS